LFGEQNSVQFITRRSRKDEWRVNFWRLFSKGNTEEDLTHYSVASMELNRQRKQRRVRKLLRVCDANEIFDRSRQGLAKRADTALSWFGYDFAKHDCTVKPSSPAKFFFSTQSVDSILESLKQRLPGRAEQIVQEAEEIRHHQFRLLGYPRLDYGENIDWHLDAVHRKRAPKKAFYKLHYLDFAECGDAKVIWELNRHQYFITLAKAYRLTGNRRYVDELVRQKRNWHSENPYPIGINWTSSLEVAFRSLSWIWTLHLLSGCRNVPDLRSEWLPNLALHGRHLERFLSTYFSPNTHLLGEALALFFLGVLFPELVTAERWKRLGWEILLQESKRQVHADGFYFEQSTHYHVYALDIFLHAAILGSANGIQVPRYFNETIEKMLGALFLLSRHGPPPQFGDDDGGRLFDPRRNQSEHMLDPLSTGAVLFKRGDFKRFLPSLTEETLWLLGEEGVRQWEELTESEVSHQPTALPDAGYYLLSTPITQLIADAGRLGVGRGGHGHADALNICLQAHGRSILIDPGTSEYVGAGPDRNLFRGTGMHNSVQVDGTDQAEIASAFSWHTFPQTTVEHRVQAPSCDLLVASHDGYCRLEQPVTHRRWIVSLKNGTYLVRDFLSGSGRHRVDIAWHLAQDLQLLGKHTFRIKGTPYILSFLPAQRTGWSDKLDSRMYSPAYGRKARTTVLRFHANVTVPADFAILLIAAELNSGTVETFRRSEHSDSLVSVYEYRTADCAHSFIFNDSGKPWRYQTVESDAKYVCHKTAPAAAEETLFFCDGSYARTADLDLSHTRRVDWAELNLCGDAQTASSSDQSALSTATTMSTFRSSQAVFQGRQ
jgi:Heparinase II/III N-terminus/Heparinase II/III-like protein